jgi:uncharacterized protein with GYD domain
MFQAKYSVAAFGAMLKKPQDRTEAAKQIIEAVGGKLHNLYFSFGEYDVVVIVEAPDDQAMGSAAVVLAASGAFSGGMTTKLATAAEAKKMMEKAKGAAASYKPITA